MSSCDHLARHVRPIKVELTVTCTDQLCCKHVQIVSAVPLRLVQVILRRVKRGVIKESSDKSVRKLSA